MAKRSKLSLFFAVLLAILLGCGGYLLFQDTTSPEISLSHTSEYVSPTLPITVTVTDDKSAVKKISVIVRHNEKIIPIVEIQHTRIRFRQRLFRCRQRKRNPVKLLFIKRNMRCQ